VKNYEVFVYSLKKWGGNCLAYACLQPGLSSFGTLNRGVLFFKRPFNRNRDHKIFNLKYRKYIGTILFQWAKRIYSPLVVFGDGLLNLDLAEDTIDKILQTKCRISFCHVGDNISRILSKRGFYITPMGYETVIDLESFNPTWRTHRWFMMALKKASKELVVTEKESIELLKEDIQRVDKKWSVSRKRSFKNQAFLTRPITFKEEMDVRCFFAYQNDIMVGFRFFDPMYKDGEVYGYSASISRYDPDAISGCSTFLLSEAIETFKTEKISELSLGLSPFKLSSLEKHRQEIDYLSHRVRLSKITFYLFKFFFRVNGFFYSFNGLSLYKSHFKARTRPIYFASKQRLPLFSIIYSYLNTINPFSLFFK
jgi:lysylphosphatidylglycerol synthetase-like protein (DUF2156 family)